MNLFKKKNNRFIYEKYPLLLQCKEKSISLTNEMYEKEGAYEAGDCSLEEWEESVDATSDFNRNVFGKAIYETFYGSGVIISDLVNMVDMPFETYFTYPFESLSKQKRGLLCLLLEENGKLRLPKEYYQ